MFQTTDETFCPLIFLIVDVFSVVMEGQNIGIPTKKFKSIRILEKKNKIYIKLGSSRSLKLLKKNHDKLLKGTWVAHVSKKMENMTNVPLNLWASIQIRRYIWVREIVKGREREIEWEREDKRVEEKEGGKCKTD